MKSISWTSDKSVVKEELTTKIFLFVILKVSRISFFIVSDTVIILSEFFIAFLILEVWYQLFNLESHSGCFIVHKSWITEINLILGIFHIGIA